METYADFLARKSQSGGDEGFEPVWMPDFLYPFQATLVGWSVRKGRSANFADCGLGKTPMQLVAAQNIVEHENKPVLIFTPLSVSAQTKREADKFGIECHVSRDGKIRPGINVTNYERIHYFDPSEVVGVVCDESSAIKAFDGKRRKQVTRFLSKLKYRGLYSATPSPNDHIELGTASEALGVLTQSDMITMFFKSSDNARHSLFKEGDFWNQQKWFFKAHAETPFWRWVCSWARALRKPSDLGDFDDSPFVLPELKIEQHVVKCNHCLEGELFPIVARTLREQRLERRATMQGRCEYVAALVAAHDKPAVVWCQYNQEGDILEKLIPDCVQVAGADDDDAKEERLTAFAEGKARVLVTKQKIAGWGLNWQHCGHHVCFPSHSFESYYQAIRRSWRFGRKDPVRVDIITTEGEAGVTENLQKKQEKANVMYANLVAEMSNSLRLTMNDKHVKEIEVPEWVA